MVFANVQYGKLDDKFCQMKLLNFFKVVPNSRKVRIKDNQGLIYFDPPKHRKVIFYVANMLFFGALIYFGYLYTPLLSAIYKYKFTKVDTKNSQGIAQNLNQVKNDEYVIDIPKIMAYSKVIENVSPFDQAEYDRVLKSNVVAQAKGSFAPGQGLGKSTYIFAHSTNNNLGMVRSNAVFYLLGELQKDDLVYINYYGQKLKYKVFDKKIVKPAELEYLNYSDPNKNVLILQTCWPIGTDWNRLLILSELVL